MSTKNDLRWRRSGIYGQTRTQCMTADAISYTLAFKEAFWALSLQGYTGPAAFRKLGYNTEVLGFERVHNTTKRIRREAKSLKGLHEGARAACACKGRQHRRTPCLTKLPDGCGGRSCVSSSKWRC